VADGRAPGVLARRLAQHRQGYLFAAILHLRGLFSKAWLAEP
jgi:hypothetical protein